MEKLTLNEFKWLKRDLELRRDFYETRLSDVKEEGGKDDTYMKNLKAKAFMVDSILTKFSKIECKLDIDMDII